MIILSDFPDCSVIQSNDANVCIYTVIVSNKRVRSMRCGSQSFDVECRMAALSSCVRYCPLSDEESNISRKNIDRKRSSVSRFKIFATSASMSSIIVCASSMVCMACFFFKMAADHRWDCSSAREATKPMFGNIYKVDWLHANARAGDRIPFSGTTVGACDCVHFDQEV